MVAAQSGAQSEGHCANAYVTDLWASVETGWNQPARSIVTVEWSYDIIPWPEEGVDDVLFRVDRRAAGSDEWELIGSTHYGNAYSSLGEPGRWVYRVSIESIVIGESVEQCSAETGDETMELHVPTPEEQVGETLKELCNEVEVIGLKAVMPEIGGPGNTLMLKWDDGMEYLRMYEDDWPFLPSAVHYAVERVAVANEDDKDAWQRLAVTTQQTWSGPADFGHWVYRVGTIRLEGEGVTQQCQPWWDEVEVRILTEEEKASQQRRIAALETQAIHCATERLTQNIQGDAKQVVEDFVVDRIAKIITDYEEYSDPDEGFRSMTGLTVMLCVDDNEPSPYGVTLGTALATLMLLEGGDYGVW